MDTHPFQLIIRFLVQAFIGCFPAICLSQIVVQLPPSNDTTPPSGNPMGPWTTASPDQSVYPPLGGSDPTFGTRTSYFRGPFQAPPQTYANPSYPPGTYPPGGTYPSGAYPSGAYPSGAYPSGAYPTGTYPSVAYPSGAYPPGAYPPGAYPNSAPNSMYPGLYGPPPTNWMGTTGTTVTTTTDQIVRLCQGPRFQQTWLTGNDNFEGKEANSIQILDTDVSLVFACPDFCSSKSPLYVIPSYSQHVWDGPSAPGFNLPSTAFSAFLDSGWSTNAEKTFGIDFGVRIGVFSAFDAVDSESVRYQGKAMGRVRLTPTTTLRAGVAYLDRVKIKLLPIGGILCFPNPDTRFDLFFPEPKLSHYCSTYGNTDVWWYLYGYYGGGSWTILQSDGSRDQIDLNNTRIMMGFEFGKSEQIRNGLRMGFFEFGYAFDQELVYRIQTPGNLDLQNSFVIRAGCSY